MPKVRKISSTSARGAWTREAFYRYRGADKSLARIDNSFVKIKLPFIPLKVNKSLQQSYIMWFEQ